MVIIYRNEGYIMIPNRYMLISLPAADPVWIKPVNMDPMRSKGNYAQKMETVK